VKKTQKGTFAPLSRKRIVTGKFIHMNNSPKNSIMNSKDYIEIMVKCMEKFFDYHGYEVTLCFGREDIPIHPEHVFVIARHNGDWLLTKHKKRGLEFPGGKVEPGETLEKAAARELFEETGAKTARLIRLGTYMVDQDPPFSKAIFFSDNTILEEKQHYHETEGPVLWSGDFSTVQGDERFSFVMKDEVVSRTLEYLKNDLEIHK
jgi:8-oxo-dGTP diphosphatase